jgi:hypothetical protein
VGDVHLRHEVAALDLFLERGEVRRGGAVRFALRVALDPGWHVNGAVPPPAGPSGAELVPTRLVLATPAPVALASVALPPGPVLQGTFWLRGELRAPEGVPLGPRRVTFLLSFQPCDATSCREATEARVEVPLRLSESDGEARHAAVFTPR